MQSNCSSNPTAEKIGKTFAFCLLVVVSLVGNTFIGIIVYKTRAMRKTINFLIVNMAVSDLLFLLPLDITRLYVGSWLISGPLGQALCKLVPLAADVSVTVSVQSLVLIAVDRFGAVASPLRSPLISSKLCPFFILATWIVAVAVRSPYLFAIKLVKYPGELTCQLKWDEVFGESVSFANYMLAIFVVFLYTPLVLIVILYIIIYLKLILHSIPGEQSANARQQRVKRERNVLKKAIAIVFGFAVCYLPYSIIYTMKLFVSGIWSCGFQYLWFVAALMARANCALSPCICFSFSKNYRESLKNLLNYHCAG